MRCYHSFAFTHEEPNGEDRVVKHYRCRHCLKTSLRNVKKPRFTASSRKEAPSQRKPAKTLQKAPVRKRKAIKPVSAKRKGWLKQYEAKKRADPGMVWGWDIVGSHVFKMQMFRSDLEPHHPLARQGCRILFYVWISTVLHEEIHSNPKWAREQGLLLPEYDGRESAAAQKDIFGILPEYRAYVAEHGLH